MAVSPPVCDFGWKAPDFQLPDTDGTPWNIASLQGPSGLLLMFICNHCPYVMSVIDRLCRDVAEVQQLGFGAAAIMSNDTDAYPEDSYGNMRRLARQYGFSFPYLFDATQAITRAAGLPRYEVPNHARPGEESRHNLTYWRYGDYAGIGPGAHGRRLCQATERHKKPENFIAAVERNGHGLKVETDLPPHERATEAMLMGLRLSEGIDLARVEARSGLARGAFVDADAVKRLAGQGLLALDGDRLAVTDGGILLLDSILSEVVRTS